MPNSIPLSAPSQWRNVNNMAARYVDCNDAPSMQGALRYIQATADTEAKRESAMPDILYALKRFLAKAEQDPMYFLTFDERTLAIAAIIKAEGKL